MGTHASRRVLFTERLNVADDVDDALCPDVRALIYPDKGHDRASQDQSLYV